MAQNQYNPDHVSHPGETLLEVLEELCMTVEMLSAKTGIKSEVIDGIICGSVPITIDIADRLGYAFDVPSRFWLARERRYRESLKHD